MVENLIVYQEQVPGMNRPLLQLRQGAGDAGGGEGMLSRPVPARGGSGGHHPGRPASGAPEQKISGGQGGGQGQQKDQNGRNEYAAPAAFPMFHTAKESPLKDKNLYS